MANMWVKESNAKSMSHLIQFRHKLKETKRFKKYIKNNPSHENQKAGIILNKL